MRKNSTTANAIAIRIRLRRVSLGILAAGRMPTGQLHFVPDAHGAS